MKPRRYFLAGLPESGKSSFLAAFWVYTNGQQAALEVTNYPEVAGYLSKLEKSWYEFTKPTRTTQQSEQTVKLKLKRKNDQAAFIFEIPDLSGETFEQIWDKRIWSREFKDMVDGASGALVFIHPFKLEDGATIAQANEIAEAAGVGPEAPKTAAANKPAGWKSQQAPTEVQLIDCLQLLAEETESSRPFRLGVVISAWDKVRAMNPHENPAAWLEAKMPMLRQFLTTNGKYYQAEVFGVSAQGGDYTAKETKWREVDPLKRCFAVGAEVVDKADVTAPFQWLVR